MTITNYAGATIQGDDGSGINLDGVDNTEQITITNHGTIQGDGVTGDGDGVDVDGVVNLNNTGTIQSLNALNDTSEGVTVGGGTIINSGTIEGSGTIGPWHYACRHRPYDQQQGRYEHCDPENLRQSLQLRRSKHEQPLWYFLHYQ